MTGVGGQIGGSLDNARTSDERVCLVASCRCGLLAVLYTPSVKLAKLFD